MKKFACKISALLCAAAMLTALLPAFGVSAAAQTKKFLDPMEDSAFPKAYSVKTILPANYDVTEAQIKANGGVFGLCGFSKISAELPSSSIIPSAKKMTRSATL